MGPSPSRRACKPGSSDAQISPPLQPDQQQRQGVGASGSPQGHLHGSRDDACHWQKLEQWAGTVPSGREGSRELLAVVGKEHQLFLTLHKVPRPWAFPRLTLPQSSLGALLGGGGFVRLSRVRWNLKESPLGGAPPVPSFAGPVQFPFMMRPDSPTLLQLSYLRFPLPHSHPHRALALAPPGDPAAKSATQQPGPAQPAHRAPLGLLFVSGCPESTSLCPMML